MLVCTSSFFPLNLHCTLDSFPLPSATNKRQPMSSNPSFAYPICVCIPDSFPLPSTKHKCRLTSSLFVDSIPIRSSYSAAGVLPLKVPCSVLRWWVKLRCETSPIRRPKVCRYCWWDYLHPEKAASLPSHSQDRPTMPMIHQHPKETWSYQFRKANDKISKARSK